MTFPGDHACLMANQWNVGQVFERFARVARQCPGCVLEIVEASLL